MGDGKKDRGDYERKLGDGKKDSRDYERKLGGGRKIEGIMGYRQKLFHQNTLIKRAGKANLT